MAYDYKKHERRIVRNAVIGHAVYLLLICGVFGAFIYHANKLDEIVNKECEGSIVKCFTVKKTK
jgi:hypothetical protein